MPAERRRVVGACALDCPDACSWVVELDGERPVALRGNPEHPFTRGHLCAKLTGFLDYAASPRRLLQPLRRVGAKGEGVFEPIGWPQALAELAAAIRTARAEHGGEAIWPFAGTGTLGLLQGAVGGGRRLFGRLGASEHALDICSVAGHGGMSYTTGSAHGMDPEDLADSALVLLWGTNTLTTNLHLWHSIRRARANGAPVVVVDPVRTRTAAAADRHLAPRPGTDGALALGLLGELVARGAVDHAYLERATLGWAEFAGTVLPGWDAARAAAECGLAEAEVSWLAEQLATRRPTGIRATMGVQHHAGGGQAVRLISCLPAVTGDYGRRGGGLSYSTGPAFPVDRARLNRPELRPGPPGRTLSMSRLGRELLERTDPPVRVLVVWAANPVVSNPDQARVRAGLTRPDLFTVVIDHVLSDTALYADLVLPGTTQLEHLDVHTAYGHRYLQWNAPATAPPGECLPHTEIFRRLAAELGLPEPELYASDAELAADALDWDHPALAGATPELLARQGWLELGGPARELPFAAGFATPSGRFEFASAAAERDGAGRLPHHLPPAEAAGPPAPGELALVSAADHHRLNSTFAGDAAGPEPGLPVLALHPADAAARGVADGARVRVSNRRGAFTAVARVGPGPRRGVAVSTKGHRPAGPERSSVNATTSDAEADLRAGTVFHDNAVRVEPLPQAPPPPVPHPLPQPPPEPR